MGSRTLLSPEVEERIRNVFSRAPFIRSLGFQIVAVGKGSLETSVELQPHHKQHHGVTHAGVVITLADHTAGALAESVAGIDKSVLSANLNVHLLRPAAGKYLFCRSTILKPGKTLIIVESEVFACPTKLDDTTDHKLVAKASVSLAVVPKMDLVNEAPRASKL
eukprot:GILJ01018668.1.p1 GENE.GILJ01018668.1~~GILJ01018668.1.p1  ORF type:complete len:164 (-),score=22.89 GILJ01018668.1:78-569(-)